MIRNWAESPGIQEPSINTREDRPLSLTWAAGRFMIMFLRNFLKCPTNEGPLPRLILL